MSTMVGIVSTNYNMKSRIVSDIQTRAEGEKWLVHRAGKTIGPRDHWSKKVF
jgi:hypothetical protein